MVPSDSVDSPSFLYLDTDIMSRIKVYRVTLMTCNIIPINRRLAAYWPDTIVSDYLISAQLHLASGT